MPGPDRTQLLLYAAAALLVAWVGFTSLGGCGGGADDARPVGGAGAESGGEGATAPGDTAGIGDQTGGESALEIDGTAANEIVVHVAGEVRRPGLLSLPDGSRVGDAIRRAGGETRRAGLDGLNLAMRLVDGQQVLVPSRAEARNNVTPTAVPGAGGPSGSTAAGAAAGMGAGADAPISLLQATPEMLETIDGIGPVTAGKIIEFRDSRGGLSSVEELAEVHGIGPATMEALREALVP